MGMRAGAKEVVKMNSKVVMVRRLNLEGDRQADLTVHASQPRLHSLVNVQTNSQLSSLAKKGNLQN